MEIDGWATQRRNSFDSAYLKTERTARVQGRNSKELLTFHPVEEFTGERSRCRVWCMIDTETVMPPVARSQTRTFRTAATSAFERKDGPTMRAIYLESKSGTEGVVAGEIPRPSPKADEVLVKVHATSGGLPFRRAVTL